MVQRISSGLRPGSNVVDAGSDIDVAARLLGHSRVSSSLVYAQPGPARREVVDRVPSSRDGAMAAR